MWVLQTPPPSALKVCVERQKATKDVAWVSPTACPSPNGLQIAQAWY